MTPCQPQQPIEMILLAYISCSCREACTSSKDNDVFSLELKLGTKPFIHSFIHPKHGLCYVYISQQRYQSGSAARQNWSSPTAWHDLQGAIGGRSHILSSSLRVWWVHLFFSIQFCRHTWLAGIIRSPIFRHLAWVQPHSEFSDRFTEGSAPTYVTSMLTGRSQIKSSPEII